MSDDGANRENRASVVPLLTLPSVDGSTGDADTVRRTVHWPSRDCPANGVSGLTRQQLLVGRLVTDDRDNHGRELDAQEGQEGAVVLVAGVRGGEGCDRAAGEGGSGSG